MSYQVAVRALAEFTAKEGDLDLRFTPSPTALEGIAGHAVVAARRGPGYQSEVALSGTWRGLQVRGRADGYDPARVRLEEVKTYRGDLARMPDNHRRLHWAQAKFYGWLMCEKLGLAEIEVALVYFDIGSQKETVLAERHAASGLRDFFQRHCERFLGWAEQERAHLSARDAALAALPFPHPAFRPGQRALAATVYRNAASAGCLMAQAPTGIGKTIGTIFPLLKAMPGQRLDKLYFLAAKTPGRGLALDALARLRATAPALPLRVVELVARDKACEHPDKACHGESCPLARGFYDRLPAARAEAAASAVMDKAGLRAIALAHAVCPYYLGQEMARWTDVAVGDYNYYFDGSALLHALADGNQWRVAVLADEAHNLVERARRMYSAELDQFRLRLLRKSAAPPLKKAFDRLQRAWSALAREQDEDYAVLADIPEAFRFALQQAGTVITDFIADNPTHVDTALTDFYFDLLHFGRLAESFGPHSLFDISRTPGKGAVLCLRNIVPAPFLAPRFAAAHCSTLFSATLTPWHYYTDLLGLPAGTSCSDIASPFSADQLAVRVARGISTRWQDRAASLAPIAAIVANQYRARPGNYLVFSSSFDYLQKIAAAFRARCPDIPCWEQSRGMAEAERDAFLARFVAGGQGIGFAVLGGPFAEGIDLPGDRLVGAFIATLGLPQVNPVNEQVRERMQQLFGAGYDYAYLYPGLQKVVQAAGRVIRTQEDRGVVWLIDDRFGRAEVRRLLPAWWGPPQLRAPAVGGQPAAETQQSSAARPPGPHACA
ncbi:MAG TPA: ATP-dependent DNA helicase [Noviherbaspirillum sp.]|jgi:DNA excision repair protein ERCC-2|uniref:ATP-dependent DNA helicase n=1 Tax=Noviherbaspirillum sp. TaxID=1926288 RepID=UPI002F953EBD